MEPEKTGDAQLQTALRPVLRHITWQHYRQWLLRSMVIGSAAALLMLIAARLFPLADSTVWAGVVGLGGFCLGMAQAWRSRPGFWEAAVAADSTGLQERAATAWQLRNSADVLAECQRRDALAHLAGLEYGQLLPWPKPKRELGLAAGLVILAMVLAVWPNPLEEAAQARKQARLGLAEARTDVRQLQKQLAREQQIGDGLKKELNKELEKLQQELKQAKSLEAGAAALAKREKELTGKLSQEEQKAKLAELARMFQDNPLTKGAADALQKLDDRELRKNMEELAAKLQGLDKAEQQKLAKLLAEAARAMQNKADAKLAAALQKAAQGINSGGKDSKGQLDELKEQLAQQLAATAGKDRLAQDFQQALAQAKGNMLARGNQGNPGNPAQTAMAGGQQGSRGNSNSSAGTGSGSNAAGNPGSNNSGNGSASSGGASGNTGGNTGNTGGSTGSGNGSGTGSGSGNGGGQGAGGGAGTGSTNQAGGTFTAGGPRSNNPLGDAPDKQGRYEQIYVPSRLGGGGTGSQVKGSMGSSGDSTQVDLANGPITGGSLLPYSEVLTQYQAEARESLDKQYIPENLKDMVKNYFTGLAEQ